MVQKMNQSLYHRGPDSEGCFTDQYVSLGHRRLAIIDLSDNGAQPMFNDDKSLAIVFNGEIYNYKEIREILVNAGLTFFSDSDTEVLLKAYQYWGIDCLSRLNGMFSFCIYDLKRNQLFLARDRFGVKPLYYHKSDKKFIFASEIKAILCHDIERIPNDKLIFDYLVYNIVDHSDETFFMNIRKIPKNHYAIYDLKTGDLSIKKYWDIETFIKEQPISYNQAVDTIRDILFDSVRIRLRSDVPVGSCFSGGIDSSTILSMMMMTTKDVSNISTFSAVYPNFIRDESKYIDMQIQKFSIQNFKTEPDCKKILKNLNSFVHHQEEPTRSMSQFAQYCVMELAHEHGYKVLLDGQGSDEIFAGYHYFYGTYFYELLYHLKWFTLAKEMYSFMKNVHSFVGLKSLIIQLTPKQIILQLFRKRAKIINLTFFKTFKSESQYYYAFFDNNSLKGAIKHHVNMRLEELLKWEDRNSMAFSVETRLPFLDYRLVQFVLSLPSSYIISHGTTKKILRDAIEGIVDDRIVNRKDKIGFDVPEDDWLRNDEIKHFVEDLISSETFKRRKYFDHESVQQQFNLHTRRKINTGMKIWQCVFLELWLREYIDKTTI